MTDVLEDVTVTIREIVDDTLIDDDGNNLACRNMIVFEMQIYGLLNIYARVIRIKYNIN